MEVNNNIPPRKSTWTEKKAKLIELYPQITEDDFFYDLGKKDVMFNALARKVGVKRDELELIFAEL